MALDRSKYNKFTLRELQVLFTGASAQTGAGDYEYRSAARDLVAEINDYLGVDDDLFGEPNWYEIPTKSDGRVDGVALRKQQKNQSED